MRKRTKRYYVYELTDPRQANHVFYVGKGTGRRVHQHASDAKHGRIVNIYKHARITDIHQAGLEVGHNIVADNLTEKEALQLERETIKRYGIQNLTNMSPGQYDEETRNKLHAQQMLNIMRPLGAWSRNLNLFDRRTLWIVRNGLREFAKTGYDHAHRAAVANEQRRRNANQYGWTR